MSDSPEKRRFDVVSGHPPSPITSKRCRLSSDMSTDASEHSHCLGGLSDAPYIFDPPSIGSTSPRTPISQVVSQCFVSGAPPSTCSNETSGSAITADCLKQQAQIMQQQTHTTRLALQEDTMSGKGTESAYARHLKLYLDFWNADQFLRVQNDPSWIPMNAQPITVTKVALFLKHESTRCKVSPESSHI